MSCIHPSVPFNSHLRLNDVSYTHARSGQLTDSEKLAFSWVRQQEVWWSGRSTYLSRRCQCARVRVRVRVTFRLLTPSDVCPQKTKPCVLILCVDFAVDGGNWIRFVDTFRLISD